MKRRHDVVALVEFALLLVASGAGVLWLATQVGPVFGVLF